MPRSRYGALQAEKNLLYLGPAVRSCCPLQQRSCKIKKEFKMEVVSGPSRYRLPCQNIGLHRSRMPLRCASKAPLSVPPLLRGDQASTSLEQCRRSCRESEACRRPCCRLWRFLFDLGWSVLAHLYFRQRQTLQRQGFGEAACKPWIRQRRACCRPQQALTCLDVLCRWNTANPAHGQDHMEDPPSWRAHLHEHLLINDKPLESFSPLGAPETSQQGAVRTAPPRLLGLAIFKV